MIAKMITKMTLVVALVFVTQQNCYAQKTNDELKAEREVLKAEMKSKDAEERKVKFEKLSEPKASGISSVDGLAANSSKLLVSTKQINALIPEMYKRTIGESVDGVTDVTVKKPTMQELTALALDIANQIKAVSDMSSNVATASNDIKSAGMMQAPKGTKSLAFTKDVLSLVLPEMNTNLKVVNNLIATLKSSGNY
ncbi:MAG: hypothetical protein EOO51_00355 [Flavobacterium sp.]|nr:MAG: hypothetical protein EOO51_00355 [Flavobacterium sp.]